MKVLRVFTVLLIFIMIGCQPAQKSTTPVVITSISVYEDFIRNIAGDWVTIHTLITGAENPHTFDLTGSDARLLQQADLIVLNGLGLEGWADQITGSAPENARIFFAGDTLVNRDSSYTGTNPHLWMDPKLAARMAHILLTPLQEITPVSPDSLESHADNYADRIHKVYQEIQIKLEEVRGSKVITQTPGIDLFLEAFGIRRVEVIVNSPGTEPSARKMTELLGLLKRGRADGIIHFPQFSEGIPRTLHEESGVPVIMMSPLINAAPHVDTYIDLLWFNADQLYNGLTRAI